MLKKILIGLVILFLAIQLIRPEQNKAVVVKGTTVQSLGTTTPQVQALLERACTDCHSNNTKYPWYHTIQPVAWWLDEHVNDGKRHLNFDIYTTYSAKKAAHKMEEVVEQIEKGEMPLESYVWMHAEAKLSAAEKQLLIDWAQKTKAAIQPQAATP